MGDENAGLTHLYRDRRVSEIEHRGRVRRVAVTVSDNGFIVGASPFSLNQKVKPLP